MLGFRPATDCRIDWIGYRISVVHLCASDQGLYCGYAIAFVYQDPDDTFPVFGLPIDVVVLR